MLQHSLHLGLLLSLICNEYALSLLNTIGKHSNHLKLKDRLFLPVVYEGNPFLSRHVWKIDHDDNNLHVKKATSFFSSYSKLYVVNKDNSNNNIDGREVENRRDVSVAIVGSGAVGCYYGARLYESQYNVKFLARGDHFEACVTKGLNVTSVDGDVFIPPSELQMYTSPNEIGPVDWILIALKSTSLTETPSLIAPLLKKNASTRILAIMNGFVDEDLVSLLVENWKNNTSSSSFLKANTIPCAAIYGGMAFLCSNRVRPGHIDHSYAGQLSGGVALSSSAFSQSGKLDVYSSKGSCEDLTALQKLWEPTKVPFVPEPFLLQARWMKNIWNLPFNGISVAMGGITTDKVGDTPYLRELANKIMNETVTIACADIDCKGGNSSSLNWEDFKAKMWYLTDSMGVYKTSTMLDFKRRKAMEVQYLFQKPVERALYLNISSPNLESVVRKIEDLQREYNLY